MRPQRFLLTWCMASVTVKVLRERSPLLDLSPILPLCHETLRRHRSVSFTLRIGVSE